MLDIYTSNPSSIMINLCARESRYQNTRLQLLANEANQNQRFSPNGAYSSINIHTNCAPETGNTMD